MRLESNTWQIFFKLVLSKTCMQRFGTSYESISRCAQNSLGYQENATDKQDIPCYYISQVVHAEGTGKDKNFFLLNCIEKPASDLRVA